MSYSLANEDTIETYKVMAIGLLIAFIVNMPFLSNIYDKNWPWAQGFPLGWLYTSLSYMIVFFHEIGHAVAYWFYGYISLPSFDLSHGGGMTYTVTGQLLFLHFTLYAALAYLFFQLRGFVFWQRLCIGIGIFQLITAHFMFHEAICIFAGHLAEVLIAGFLLLRAWFNLTIQGLFERFLSAAFGFGMIINYIFGGWALIHNEIYREFYYEQKSSHGFGDLDRVADMLNVSFSSVVTFYICLALIALLIPYLLYLKRDNISAFIKV